MRKFAFVTSLLACITMGTIAASPSMAHEYYLLPDSFSQKSGTEFGIEHRLGQRFKGNQLPYITQWNIRSEVWHNGTGQEVRGKDGDRPAIKFTATSTGLIVGLHQSNVDFITFKTYEKFQNYVNKEGIEHALAASENGTKPKIDLREGYSRFAKTLVVVDGDKTGLDRPTGLKIEFVALANPNALGANDPMPVQVLYEGKPLAGITVKVFAGIDTEYAYRVKTDTNGKAMIKPAGKGPYLINAVHMTEPQSDIAKTREAHWESFWASLTFERAN